MSENLDHLSREQLLFLHDLLEEQDRRVREGAANYSPNPGQLPIHQSEAEIRVVTAGNRGGKTALAVNEALWRVKGYNPILKQFTKVPARVVVLLDHPEKVELTWLPELRKWHNFRPEQLRQRGKPYISQIVFDNGSEILFMFHQQEPMMFESMEYDFLEIDEPCPRNVWIALRRGGSKKGAKPRFLIVGTPIAGSWLRTDLIEPATKGELADCEVFRYGTVLNEKNLEDGYVEKFGRILSEKERRIRLEGEFYDLEGLALADLLDASVHIIDPFDWPYDWPVVVAIDPHQQKPHHAVMLGCDKDGYLYYLKEFKLKAPAGDFANELRKWYDTYRVIDIVVDSFGKTPYSGGNGFDSFVQVLQKEGVRARVTTYDDKSDEDFINRIQTALAIPVEVNNFGTAAPKLRFFRGKSYGILHDIENVAWLKHKSIDDYKPKLDISNKDFLSCLKYALATNLVPGKSKQAIYRPNELPQTYVGRSTNPNPTTIRFGMNRPRRPRR